MKTNEFRQRLADPDGGIADRIQDVLAEGKRREKEGEPMKRSEYIELFTIVSDSLPQGYVQRNPSITDAFLRFLHSLRYECVEDIDYDRDVVYFCRKHIGVKPRDAASDYEPF